MVELYHEGKTMREIASAVHMSFGDIGKIIKRIDGRADDIDISSKSKAAQAMYLFKCGKKSIDVAIELDIPANEIEDILQEYWVLIQLDELALVYYEIRSHLDLFLKIFHTLKKSKLINQKDMGRLLRYAAFDLPSMETKIHRLTSDVIDLERKKKQSRDEVAILSSGISQLKKSLNWYKMEIEQKKQIISNLNQQLNQKSKELEEKLLTQQYK